MADIYSASRTTLQLVCGPIWRYSKNQYQSSRTTLQLVCGPIWRYSKNQYQCKADLKAFNDRKEELRQLHERIQSRLGRERQTDRKIARPDVLTWLTAAGQEVNKQSVEDEVSQSGCLLSHICRTRILKRTADLVQLLDQGRLLSQMPSLVDDAILLDDIQCYKDQKEKLLSILADVQSRLHEQLQDGGKIEEAVKLWLRNVEEKTSPAATSFENQFANGPYDGDFPRRFRERKQQLEELLREGDLLPESLVVDDYSQTLGIQSMADIYSAALANVQSVCGPIWRYSKNQYQCKADLKAFNDRKEGLRRLHERIQSRVNSELQTGRKIVLRDVETWLILAREEIDYRQSVEDEVSQSGCLLSCICRTRVLTRRTADLVQLLDQGESLSQLPSLVDDDYSAILLDDIRCYKDQKEKLLSILADVQSRLHEQLQDGGKIEEEAVKLWLRNVEEKTSPAATSFENQFANGPYDGDFPRRFRERKQQLEELLREGALLPESLVVDPWVELKAEIWGHLMGDETSKIGVWGMGGVGKTTITVHVYNQLLKEPKFKKVVWVTVSETFDVHRIQQEIASGLGGNLPEHQSTGVRAATLSKMLETRKPCVVILDDVWRSFDLEEVGIPQPCKLLLTTRSKGVAREMGCATIEVKTLSPEASLTLFKDIVGDVALSEDGDIKNTLKLIVDECDGLPSAIKVVAGGMKGIFEPRRWRAALSQLRQGRRKDVYSKLKFSYDWLNDKNIQHCFLHCALYPEDHKIPKEELIEYWIAEELIDDEELIDVMGKTRLQMKDEGHFILSKLEENCFLEFTRDRSSVRDSVRMHGLVRDMAIDITRSSSPCFLVKAGVGLEELPKEHEWKEDLLKISLMRNSIEDIPENFSPRCPILTTLLLSHNNFSTIPENFFQHMPELKVLDLSYNRNLRSLPSSVSELVKLTTLLLRYCESLKELPSLSNLTALKKLDLLEAGLEEVPHGVEMLLNLKYLDIRRLSGDRVSTGWKKLVSEILPNLSKLQHLGLDPRVPVEGGQLSGIWPKLENFYGGFRTWSDMCIFRSKRQKSFHYNIYVGNPYNPYNDDIYLLKYINIYDINICGEPGSIPSDVQELLISDCNDVRSLNAIAGFEYVVYLQRCEIRDCREVEYVFSGLNHLLCLKELRLWELENLKGLFDLEEAAPPLAVFSSLEEISVKDCPKIKKLFPTTLQYLPNLKAISIDNCSQLEEIMVASLEEEEGRAVHAKLERLNIERLPMLRSISCLTDASVFDSLKDLRISRCRNLDMEYVFGGQLKFNSFRTLETLWLVGLLTLKSIFHEEADESLAFSAPLSSTETISFPLKELRVKDCPQLKNIFPHAVQVGSFQNIESIDVIGCDLLEEIMSASSETEEDQSKPILPKLERLSLIELPVLRRICSALLVPDSLEKLTIEDCPNLNWECLFGLHAELPRELCSLRLKGVRNLESVFDEEASDSLAFWRLPPAATTSFALRRITVANCPQLKKIFPHAWQLDYLQKVDRFEVTGCDELEEIISSKSEEEPPKLTHLPKLERLHMHNLPKLKRVCTVTSALICDSLMELTISGCKELKRFPLHLPVSANGQLSPPPRLLKIELSVKEKEWWESLEWDQPNVEAVLSPLCIFKWEYQSFTLPKLRTLQLNQLPELEHIRSSDRGLICESLDTVVVTNCEKLERIPLFLSQLEGGARNLTLDSGKWQRSSSSSSSSQLRPLNNLLSKYDFSFDDSDEEEEEEDSEKEEANSNESPSSGSHNAIKAADQNQ